MVEVIPAAPEVVEALRGEHGDRLVELKLQGGKVNVTVRRPKQPDYRRWKEQTRREQTRALAGENLARACILYPTPEVMSLVVDDYPAIFDTIGSELLSLAGLEDPEKKVL